MPIRRSSLRVEPAFQPALRPASTAHGDASPVAVHLLGVNLVRPMSKTNSSPPGEFETHRVAVEFAFKGFVKVKASSSEEAQQIVRDSLGLTLGGNIHQADDRIIDWEVETHPNKTVSQAVVDC